MNNYGMETEQARFYWYLRSKFFDRNLEIKNSAKSYYEMAFQETKNGGLLFLREFGYSDMALSVTHFLVIKREDVQRRWNKRAIERAVGISSSQLTTRKRRM